MRTVTLVGLLYIADAIQNPIVFGTTGMFFVSAILCTSAIMDLVEFASGKRHA